MASFTLGEILKAVSGVLLQQGSHEYCTGVNTDTRTISPGELFIALQGNTFDGHHFLMMHVLTVHQWSLFPKDLLLRLFLEQFPLFW